MDFHASRIATIPVTNHIEPPFFSVSHWVGIPGLVGGPLATRSAPTRNRGGLGPLKLRGSPGSAPWPTVALYGEKKVKYLVNMVML